MNRQNLIFYSFKRGFWLTNKSISLFLIVLTLSLLGEMPDLLGNSPAKSISQVIGFLLVIVQIGFYFSLPIFLVNKQQGKTIFFSKMLLITLKNAKRLILPSIIMFASVFLVVILSFFLLAQFAFGGDYNFMQSSRLGFYVWNIIVALIVGLFSFLTFAPIYFSLEKNSFLNSVKKSISFCLNNFNFFLIIFIVSVFTLLITTLLFNDFQNPYHLFIRNILANYEYILLAAASLIFYQNRTAK